MLSGERYKMVTKEFKGLLRGEYGRTPGRIDPDFIKRILGDEPLIPGRPADSLPPEIGRIRKEIAPWYEQEEDILSYALFENVARDFFDRGSAGKGHQQALLF